MKKLLFSFLLTCLSVGHVMADEGKVVIATAIPTGENLTVRVTRMNDADKVYVDWGDGTIKEAQLEGWSSSKKCTGKLLSDTVRVYGDFKELEVSESKVSYLKLSAQPHLINLDMHKNELTYDGLDLSGAPNLENINLNNNSIVRLDLRLFTKLSIFSINHNPTLTTVLFANGSTALTNIDMSDCDVTHFYPVSLPNLKYLNLANDNLSELELNTNYPELRDIDVTGSQWMEAIDVTRQAKLEKLSIGKTSIKELNLVNNTELIALNAPHTALTKLDLTTNKVLTTLILNSTKIERLVLAHLPNLQYINVDSTLIQRLDLSHQRFLRDVSARATGIQFLDMHGAIGTNRLRKLDIRNCENMTAQSLNFTFMAMPVHTGASYGKNVFIAGSHGEHAKTELLKYDEDNYYKVDVEGDGTAPMDSISITALAADNGTYTLSQVINGGSYDTWGDITAKALPGFPIRVKSTPAAGMEFVGVEINGKLYADSIFVVSAAATVKPVFKATGNNNAIVLKVPSGKEQQYFLSADTDDTEIQIDWGNGEKETIVLRATPTLVKGTTAGTTVTIYGAVTGADVSSYPGVSIDNRITSIDLSRNTNLRSLQTYMNRIGSIDVSRLSALETLDCAYSDLETLDVSNNPKLTTLRAYGNHIESLNLANATGLLHLDMKNNWLTALDISHNKKLTFLNLNHNEISQIDVRDMADLAQLDVSNNNLNVLNVDNNMHLTELHTANNKLTQLNLSHNPLLATLSVEGNKLISLDLTGHDKLAYLNVGGNSWDACTLNDLYYSLSQYPKTGDESKPRGNTLYAKGDKADSYNDAEHAESAIAVAKGWKVNYEGDGSGCTMAYITVTTAENGTVKVFTTTDTEVLSGTKVAKNTVLVAKSTPAAGYALVSATANGQPLDNDGQFIVTEATTVAATFTISSGINDAKGSTFTAMGGAGELTFLATTPTDVRVFTAGGKLMFTGMVNNRYTLSLPAGVYIVKTQGVAKAIAVR